MAQGDCEWFLTDVMFCKCAWYICSDWNYVTRCVRSGHYDI